MLAAAVEWLDLAPRVAWIVLAIWIAKDIAMFPFVRRAYGPARPAGADALVGRRVRARGPVGSQGWVRVDAELWRAELAPGSPPVEDGQRLHVRAVRGLVLVVEPEEDVREAQSSPG